MEEKPEGEWLNPQVWEELKWRKVNLVRILKGISKTDP